MPEKAANAASPWNPMVQSWFKVLTLAFLLGVLVVWGIDGWKSSDFDKDFFPIKLNTKKQSVPSDLSSNSVSVQLNSTYPEQNLNQTHLNLTPIGQNPAPDVLSQTQFQLDSTHSVNPTSPQTPRELDWISSELEPNYSSNLLARWLTPGGEPCKDSKTEQILILGLDGRDNIELPSGEIHEFVIQTLDGAGEPHCVGGDYFETDLSGDFWKSRPPVKDLGNGTYKFSLQVHSDFPGNYFFSVFLLFGHYEGLKYSTERFAVDRLLRNISINFHTADAKLPEIKRCRKSDFDRDVWSGRWTRHAKNESCLISNDGRYRCQERSYPCPQPWCGGALGMLESNGWAYSIHCSFNLFSGEEAWECLNRRWIFWWGDSNHCDTLRNLLHFVLNVTDIKIVPRRFDMNITNPRNPSQRVRFTSIFNGHANASGNYQGLNSLIDGDYRDLLRGYFAGEVVPDAVIMNTGLHDGIFWPNIRRFVGGVEYATAFWRELMDGVRRRGLAAPEVIYRTTVATGGYARRLAFNPQKMEAFNGVVLDKLRRYGVVSSVVDDFDLTYPWHFDNRCNDGVHYGRAPLKMRWRDGGIGHQYFVDLMLCHVLLNVLCAR